MDAVERITEALTGIGLAVDLVAATSECPCKCWQVQVLQPAGLWRTTGTHNDRVAALADLAEHRQRGKTARITTNPKDSR